MDREDDKQIVATAAASLVLFEGSRAEVRSTLEPWAGPAVARHWEQQLTAGPREQRARALAAVLTGLALDLQDWRAG